MTSREELRERKFQIAPQMRVYAEVPWVLAPYMIKIARPNFRSEVVNTDGIGFRMSCGRDGLIDSRSWWHKSKRAIVIGGSTVFGVGATHDRHTLVSALNALTEYSFLNLGLRAGNSTQELIASIPFLASSECVVVCSGINNLATNLQSIGKNDLFGPFFSEEIIEALAEYTLSELFQLARKACRSPLRSVGFQALLIEMIRRVQAKLSRRRGEPSGQVVRTSRSIDSSPLLDMSVKDLHEASSRALELQKRDLRIIVRSLPSNCRLIFSTQPFAGVSCKEFTPEERELFEIADGIQNVGWTLLKTHMRELWPTYQAGLREFCASNGMTFIDLNTVNLSGWSYVDRVHMTDNGYMQAARTIVKEIG